VPNPLVIILAWYLALSLVTFGVYGFDKRRARRGGRRVRERTLQGLALVGGWPGALLGRRTFHHKTLKRGFTAVLYAIALLHVAAWAYLLVSGA
jgi:uncharacterized membrane protein YsdA (DUF1294 family)